MEKGRNAKEFSPYNKQTFLRISRHKWMENWEIKAVKIVIKEIKMKKKLRKHEIEKEINVKMEGITIV